MSKDNNAQLDQLIERLQTVQKKREAHNRFRLIAGGIIVGCIGYMSFSIHKSVTSIDKQMFVDNTVEQLKIQFDAEDLYKKAQAKLVPTLKESLNKAFEERIPRIEERSVHFIDKNRERIIEAVELEVTNILADVQMEIQKEFPKQDLTKAFSNFKGLNDQIVANFRTRIGKHYKNIEPSVNQLRTGLDKLADTPEVQQLTVDQAKVMFIESVLDLFKYQVNPDRGLNSVSAEAI